jgi:tetratricopeptide (TPR) repeat protein
MREITDGPYPGARAFRQSDRGHFFGRAPDTADVVDLWRDNRLTVIYGPVASGKSSLLRAGVHPRMAAQGYDVLPPASLRNGETFPFAAFPEYNSYNFAVLRSWDPDEMPSRLAGQTVSDFARRRSRRHGGIVFAAIDQVEDLFLDSGSGLRGAWRRQFADELARAVRDESGLHLLLVARAEAAGPVAERIGSGAKYEISALTRAQALEAITAPAANTGHPFTKDAAGKLVTDLLTSRIAATNGAPAKYVTANLVEPVLLQIVCARMWHDLPPGTGDITARDVRAFGDVDTALAAYWSETIAAVAADHDLTAERLRTWLTSAFVTEPGTSRPVDAGPSTTAGLPNSVVRDLVDRHLLKTKLKSTVRWYELLSERLIEPLRKAHDELPPAPSAASYLKAAGRALTLGELDPAQEFAEQVLLANPPLRLRAEAHSLLGNLAFEREKPEGPKEPDEGKDPRQEAEEHYREAASLFEAVRDTESVARQMAAVGRMLLAQGKTADAVAELRAAVDRVPNDLSMQTELAVALWSLGEGRAAVAILTSVLAIDGGYPAALRARGEILADLGNGRDAMLDLDRQRVPDRPSTMAARGLALAELGDHSRANREIDDALKKAPRNGRVLLYAARVCELAGDRASSENLARQAVVATDPPLSPQQKASAQRLAGHERTNRAG